MLKNVLITILIVAVAAGAGYVIMQNRIESQVQEVSRKADDTERTRQQRIESLEEQLVLLQKEISAQEATLDEAVMQEAFGGEDNETAEEDNATETLRARVMHFFRYLDEKGYLEARGIQEPAAEHFMKILERLKASRPVVSGETRDMYTLLKNITYFFRILGKAEVLAIRDILAGEAEIIEPTMEMFYEWLSPWPQQAEPGRPVLDAEVLYDYAGYFLQTIAGQAYLFRRDSKVRHLTAYYCILVLDRANSEDLNSHGIDIRPHLDKLIHDLQSSKHLAGRRGYLQTLRRIKDGY
ncbi:hypothetical protein ACFL43_01650 [Thermodesulfobacteriota bacterium]